MLHDIYHKYILIIFKQIDLGKSTTIFETLIFTLLYLVHMIFYILYRRVYCITDALVNVKYCHPIRSVLNMQTF